MRRAIIPTMITGCLFFASCLPYQDHCSQNNLAEIKPNAYDPKLAKGTHHSLIADLAEGLLMEIESSAYMIKLTEQRDVQYLATMGFRDMLITKNELNAIVTANKWAIPQSLTTPQKNILAHLEKLDEDERNHYYVTLFKTTHEKVLQRLKTAVHNQDQRLAKFAQHKLQELQGHLFEARHVLKILNLISGDKGDRPLKISQDEATAE